MKHSPMYSSSSLDIPKSDIFTEVSKSTKQFRAAKSLWMQFFDSRYRMPKNRTTVKNLIEYYRRILTSRSISTHSHQLP